MKDSQQFDEAKKQRRPGDRVIRIMKQKRKDRLRIIPNIPGVLRFIGDILRETPFVPLFFVLIVILLISSLGIFLAEQPVNSQFETFGYTLWWSFTAMQTQGANSPGPITPIGMIIGAIWSIIGTIAFFGVIIATFYAYYVDPKRRPSKAIIDALQYNLEKLDELSVDELSALEDTVTNLVSRRIAEIQKNSQNQ
ncbi:ion transporter [Chloroflexota bacterium]